MDKLTTERLEEIAKLEITEFSDGMDIAKDAYQSVGSSEIVLMARQLLAYEQAAKNPVAFVDERGGAAGGICWAKSGKRELPHGTELYAAPVLPKQPDVTLTDEGETAKIVKAAEKLVRCKGRYHSEQNYRALAALFGVTVPDLPPLPTDEEPAQPVIPEQQQPISYIFKHPAGRLFWSLTDESNKWQADVIPVYAEPHELKIPPAIEPDYEVIKGILPTANPDEYACCIAADMWNACRAEMIKAQPVSEPYKLPHDWIERQFAYQNLFNAIAAVVSKHPNIEISIKALDNSRLAAAPAQEHE